MHDKAFPSYRECSSDVLHYHQNAVASVMCDSSAHVLSPRHASRNSGPSIYYKTSPGGGRGGGWRKTRRSRADDDVGVCCSHVSFSSLVCLSLSQVSTPAPAPALALAHGQGCSPSASGRQSDVRARVLVVAPAGRPGNRSPHQALLPSRSSEARTRSTTRSSPPSKVKPDASLVGHKGRDESN